MLKDIYSEKANQSQADVLSHKPPGHNRGEASQEDRTISGKGQRERMLTEKIPFAQAIEYKGQPFKATFDSGEVNEYNQSKEANPQHADGPAQTSNSGFGQGNDLTDQRGAHEPIGDVPARQHENAIKTFQEESPLNMDTAK